jgi:hypothetical protein
MRKFFNPDSGARRDIWLQELAGEPDILENDSPDPEADQVDIHPGQADGDIYPRSDEIDIELGQSPEDIIQAEIEAGWALKPEDDK